MIRQLFLTALFSGILAPQFSHAALLAYTSPGIYHLHASPDGESGAFFPDDLLIRQSAGAIGYALAATEHKASSRNLELNVWAGAKASGGQYVNGLADTGAEVVLLPEEGEGMGSPVTLFAQLVVRSFAGVVDFPTAPSASALIAYASIATVQGGPSHSFSGPGLVTIQAKIGVPLEISMLASALALVGPSAQNHSYAAMDMQLVLGLDATLPASLTPLPAVPGDATLDGSIDGADYTVWADGYLQTTSQGGWRGDFNRDGHVDGVDYTIWADHFSPASLATPAISAVPEPAGWLLATLGVVGCCGIRRIARRWHF